MSDLTPLEESTLTLSEALDSDYVVLSSSNKIRKVRTPEGAKRYGVPIGSVIIRDAQGKMLKVLHKGDGHADNGPSAGSFAHSPKAAKYGATASAARSARAGSFGGAKAATKSAFSDTKEGSKTEHKSSSSNDVKGDGTSTHEGITFEAKATDKAEVGLPDHIGNALRPDLLTRVREHTAQKDDPTALKALVKAVKTNKPVDYIDGRGRSARVMPDGRNARRDDNKDSGWASAPLDPNAISASVGGGSVRSFTYAGRQKKNWDEVGASTNQQHLLDTPDDLPNAVQGKWTLNPKAKSHKAVSFHVASGDKVSINEDNNGASAFVLRKNGSGQYFSTSPNPTYPNGHVETHPDNVRAALESASRGHKEQRVGAGQKQITLHTMSRFVTEPPAHVGSVERSDTADVSTRVADPRSVRARNTSPEESEWDRSRRVFEQLQSEAKARAATTTSKPLPLGESGKPVTVGFRDEDTISVIKKRSQSIVFVKHADGSGALIANASGDRSQTVTLDRTDVTRLEKGRYVDSRWLGPVPAPTDRGVSGTALKRALGDNPSTLDAAFDAARNTLDKPGVSQKQESTASTGSVSHVKATKTGENEHGKIWSVSSHTSSDNKDLHIVPVSGGFRVSTSTDDPGNGEVFPNVKAAKAWIDKNGSAKDGVAAKQPHAKVSTVSSVAHVKASKMGENEHGKIWDVSSHTHQDKRLAIVPTKDGVRIQHNGASSSPTDEVFPNVKAAKAWIDKNGSATGDNSAKKGVSKPEPAPVAPKPERKNGVPENLPDNASVYQVGDNVVVEIPDDAAGKISRTMYLPDGKSVSLDHAAFDAMDISKATDLDPKTLEPAAKRALSREERAQMVKDTLAIRARTFELQRPDGSGPVAITLPGDLKKTDAVLRTNNMFVVQRDNSNQVTMYSAAWPQGTPVSFSWLRGDDSWDESKVSWLDPQTFKPTTAPETYADKNAAAFSVQTVLPEFEYPFKDEVRSIFKEGDRVLYGRTVTPYDTTHTVYVVHDDGSSTQFSSLSGKLEVSAYTTKKSLGSKNFPAVVTPDHSERNNSIPLLQQYMREDQIVSDAKSAATVHTTLSTSGVSVNVPKFSANDTVYVDTTNDSLVQHDTKTEVFIRYGVGGVSLLNPQMAQHVTHDYNRLDPLTLHTVARPPEANATVDHHGSTYRISASPGDSVLGFDFLDAPGSYVVVQHDNGSVTQYLSDGSSNHFSKDSSYAFWIKNFVADDGMPLNEAVTTDDGGKLKAATASQISEKYRYEPASDIKVMPADAPSPKWGEDKSKVSLTVDGMHVTVSGGDDVYHNTVTGSIWRLPSDGSNAQAYSPASGQWSDLGSRSMSYLDEAALVRVYPPQEVSLDSVPKLDNPTPETVFSGTNPGYGAQLGYGVNCVRASVAFELRQRGFDVEARQGSAAMGDSRIADLFVDKDGKKREFTSVSGLRGLVSETKNDPVGSRYFITVAWKNYPAAHIFNFEKTENGIVFRDAQIGEFTRNTSAWAPQAKNFNILRVDDLTPVDAAILRQVNPASVEKARREKLTDSWFKSVEQVSGQTLQRRADGVATFPDLVPFNKQTRPRALGVDEKRQTPVFGVLGDKGEFIPDPEEIQTTDIASGSGGRTVPSAATVSADPKLYYNKSGKMSTDLGAKRVASQFSTGVVTTTPDDWTNEDGTTKFGSYWYVSGKAVTVSKGSTVYKNSSGQALVITADGTSGYLHTDSESWTRIQKRSLAKTIRDNKMEIARMPDAYEVSQISDNEISFGTGAYRQTLSGITPMHDVYFSASGNVVKAHNPTTGETLLWSSGRENVITPDSLGSPGQLTLVEESQDPAQYAATKAKAQLASIVRPSARRIANNPDYTDGTYLGSVFDKMVKELSNE